MDKLEYLRTHFKEIFETYKIPKFNKKTSILSINTIGCCDGTITSIIPPTKLGTIVKGAVIIANGIPKFQKTTPDIYPLIVKYSQRIGIEETELYTKALVTKSTFSKIRTMRETGYKPKKTTVLRLCLILRLSVYETQEMLMIIEQSLSNAVLIDKVVAYCLEKNIDDFIEVDKIYRENEGENNTLLPNYA